MNDFERFSYDEICTTLAGIDADVIPDVYVLSFYVFDRDDDPRYPILQVGYNTRSHSFGWPIASDPQEAKWNFAFWLQNELRFIGEPGTQGRRLLEELLKAKGLWYSDEDERADFDRCTPIATEISDQFMAMCVRIARELHASGVIKNRFLQPLPIVLHKLDYDDQIALQTAEANPPGLAKEFLDWVSSLGQTRV
jgi:hypothetical protein